ncbi:hypothetical protein [Streptococcus himalayensis]|uniref:Uncharacterized protein n=1 Tax=Streptococcus himalayensis TaxID=1888195 RepID=A0A917A998_9STRE|nr:hypothetical protein [Streptococcus himalayensis]GGE34410.1 hypothetical protein GCM10011510_14700 [Streptococcus himalayensis]
MEKKYKHIDYVKKEACYKTILTFCVSILTSLLIPLVISVLSKSYGLDYKVVISTFFTKGTLVTIVISHVITFVINALDSENIFFTPKFWKYQKSKDSKEDSYSLFFAGSIGLLLFAVILHLIFLGYQPGDPIILPIIASTLLFILDIIFNYRLTIKKEMTKDDKYMLLEFTNDLEFDQETMKKNKDKQKFDGGKL